MIKVIIKLVLVSYLLSGNTFCSIAQETLNPMSCKIKGRVVKIVLQKKRSDDSSICSKYPCKAKVRIMDVYGCGSSIVTPINKGDTIEMNFAFTLKNTKKTFPKMKMHYPGLKKGSVFTANISELVKLGGQTDFIVYDYRRN